MLLQFSSELPHQKDAVNTVVELFNGQPNSAGSGILELAVVGPSGLALTEKGLSNSFTITEGKLLTNCREIQKKNGLPESETLEYLRLDDGDTVGSFPNFTVEMETGTGKTYVYLRTIYELNLQYGFKKFVIVVPSIAIREGVLKNLQITHDHFQSLYNHETCSFSVYESGKVNELRNFALSNAIQVLVINIDSFAKDSTEANGDSRETKKKKSKGNVINQVRETGVRPIEYIQATNPVVIVDEPQNMETDIRKQAIARLNPLCTLRYSATPRNSYNLVYKLDPVMAYELGLVKQIGVDSVLEVSNANQAYVEIEGFKTGKRSLSAKLRIWVNGQSGPERKTVTVKNGDDLFEVSNKRETYKNGFIVNDIDAADGFVSFANELTVREGSPQGTLTEAILKLQVETTVKRHLEKERKLRKRGIKVLSVFFIDRVAHYRAYDEEGKPSKGKYALWFEEAFDRLSQLPEYKGLYDFDSMSAHNGYFSQDKQGRLKDSTERGSQEDIDTYALIMKDKEKLLDPAEPLRFIFSHSALREGWDNPNVFQICTLAESSSEMKKRQEIGRGLRLAVNDQGERVMDRDLNRLTIIANESYEDFAKALQTEMESQGVTFKKELVKNERNKVTVKLKKGYAADENFLALWERIKQRTRYRVDYSTEKLIEEAAEAVKNMATIDRPKIAVARADIAITEKGVTSTEVGRRTQTVEAKYIMPDFVGQIQAKSSLAKATVASILLKSSRLQDAVNNPQAFIDQVADAINTVKRKLLVGGVEYLKVAGLEYELRRFETDDLRDVFESNVVAVLKQEKTLFSHIVIDSESSPEKAFAQACEDNNDVHFYIKLPHWFTIETPVGTYNPDWALVYKNDEALYFVAETKDPKAAKNLELLRPLERLKIECGKKHFKQFEQVRFKVVNNLSELIS
jgi:type III restriction enzyme